MHRHLEEKPQLSLIVPIYKQAETIVKNIQHIYTELKKTQYKFEVICVLDGYVDTSRELLVHAQLPSEVKICGYITNRGKAAAIQYGMRKACGVYIMFIDAGMDIDTSSIRMLMAHLQWYNADIIVGSKRHPASQVTYPMIRKILSTGYYWLTKMLFGVQVTDTQTGVKVFRYEVVQAILPHLKQKGFVGDLEMLLVAKQQGFSRIFEAPVKVDITLAPLTSAATMRSIWRMMIDTMLLWISHRRGVYRIKLTKHQVI